VLAIVISCFHFNSNTLIPKHANTSLRATGPRCCIGCGGRTVCWLYSSLIFC